MKNFNHTSADEKKRHKPKSFHLLPTTRFSFALLSFAFTLISAWNGFHFYLITFGLTLAILITATFEVARFTSLFRYIRAGQKNGIMSVLLYLITAVVCAFASINSFNAGIVRKNQSNDRAVQEHIFQVKQTYAQKMAKEIEKIDQDTQYLKNMASRYPIRGYWKRRLSDALTQKDSLITERDRFLATNPQDPQQWIGIQAAILGLKIGDLSRQDEDVVAVNRALKELWGLDQVMAQKIIGIGVTLTVELSILLLAMLATQNRSGRKRKKNYKANGILNRFEKEEERETIEDFLKSGLEELVKTGKLPPLSKINKNLRPLGRYLRNLDPAFLRDLVQSRESEKNGP